VYKGQQLIKATFSGSLEWVASIFRFDCICMWWD